MSSVSWPQDAVADHQTNVENGADPVASMGEVARHYGHDPADLRAVFDRVAGGYEEALARWLQVAANKRAADAKLEFLDGLVDEKPAIAGNALSRILTIQKALPKDRTLWSAAHDRAVNRARTNSIRAGYRESDDNAQNQ